jgi:cystine transport system substrate-binding protein
LKAQDAQLAAKQRSAVLGLYSLDQQLSAAQWRLAGLRTQTRVLHAQQATLTRELTIARHDTLLAQKRLGARLRLLYEQGNVEPLEIVFGAKTLDDALTGLDNFNRVAGQDKAVLGEVKAARSRLLTTSRGLTARAAALAEATASAQATAEQLAQARAQRNAYLGSLATQRRLTQSQIAALVERAHAAQVRSAQIVQPVATTAVAPLSPAVAPSFTAQPVSDPGGRTITVSATGYSLGGTTSTGLPVGYGVAAVDPSVIPLGSHMTVPGYGEAVAADTGGAIIGATIDLWFPTAEQAFAWGRRTVTIVIH